jgi:hypothetical protein
MAGPLIPVAVAALRAVVPILTRTFGGIFGRGAAAGAARGAAGAAKRGGAIRSTIFGAGASFLGGLFSGATGGKLGDSGNNNSSNNGTAKSTGPGSFFGISNSSNTKIDVPSSSKDECCAQTIALLSSIDETLKRSLYISQRLASQNNEIMAEGGGNQKIAGLGGGAEGLRDTAEKTGYGLGKMILESAALFILSNAGKIFDLGKETFDGINKTLDDVAKSPLISPVVEGVDTLFKGGYQAKTEEGKAAGPLGGIVGGALTGMAIGAAGGTAAAPGPGTVIGAIGLGILGAIMGQDAFEVLGDTFATSFNDNVDSEKIGEEVGESFLSKTKNKIDFFMASVAPGYNPGGSGSLGGPANTTQVPTSLGDFIAKYEAGGDANIYNKYDPSSKSYPAVRGKDLSSMSLNDIMKEQSKKNMFAVGKYQYIPTTLKGIVDKMKEKNLLSGNERFTEDLQNKIFSFTIMNDDGFKNLRKYLSGDVSAKKEAMVDLAKVWRALPDPNTGRTFGDEGAKHNRSLVPLEEVSNFLDKMLPSTNSIPLTSLPNSMPSLTSLPNETNETVAGNSWYKLMTEKYYTPAPTSTMPLKLSTNEIDRAALSGGVKSPMAAPNTIVMNQPAPAAKNNKTPAVPYPVDGPRLAKAISQFDPVGRWD